MYLTSFLAALQSLCLVAAFSNIVMSMRPLELWVRGKGSSLPTRWKHDNNVIANHAPVSSIIFETATEANDAIEGINGVRILRLAQRKDSGGVEQSTIVDSVSNKNIGIKLRYTSSTGAAAQSLALSLVGSVELIVLEFIDVAESCMIPVENLVAACSKTGTKLAVCAQSASVVPGIAFALDSGADALILPSEEDKENGMSPEEFKALWEAASIAVSQRGERLSVAGDDVTGSSTATAAGAAAAPTGLQLSPAVVTDVSYGALGDRVCIDLVCLLNDQEGILVGSSAKSLCMVHGETFESEFVPSRPFRINAGPVHSYVLLADGSTKYLSELKAGDKVMVVNAGYDPRSGSTEEAINLSNVPVTGTRDVAIGRLKVEPRPLVQVEFSSLLSVHIPPPPPTPSISSSSTGGAGTSTTSVSAACVSEEDGSGSSGGAAAGSVIANSGGIRGQVFLQQAETVRMFAAKSSSSSSSENRSVGTGSENSSVGSPVPPSLKFKAVSVTEIRKGDHILVSFADKGTHVGKRIEAKVTER